MRWLLDTNTISRAVRGWSLAVRAPVNQTGRDDVVVSGVTVAELWCGAEKRDDPERQLRVFEAFLDPYEVLPFDRAAAERHGLL